MWLGLSKSSLLYTAGAEIPSCHPTNSITTMKAETAKWHFQIKYYIPLNKAPTTYP